MTRLRCNSPISCFRSQSICLSQSSTLNTHTLNEQIYSRNAQLFCYLFCASCIHGPATTATTATFNNKIEQRTETTNGKNTKKKINTFSARLALNESAHTQRLHVTHTNTHKITHTCNLQAQSRARIRLWNQQYVERCL